MLRRGIPIRIQLLIISLFLVIVPVLILGTLLFDRVSREFENYLVQSLEEETELVYGMVEREFHNLERRSERVARAIMYAARGEERLTAENIDGLAHTLGAEVRPYAERSDGDGADRLLRTVSIIGGPKLSVEISSAQTKERLLEYLGEKRIGERGYIFVLDRGSGAYRLLRGERRSTAADAPAEEEEWLEGLLRSAGELEKGEIGSLHHRSAGAAQERELEQAAVYTRFGPWDWVIGVNAAFADFRKGIDQVRTYLFLLTVGFLFFAFLAAYTVGRIYSRPIARLEEAVGRVGRGDLTDDVALKSSTRELLRLSRDFDRNLLDGMRKIVTDIKRVAEEIRENEEQVTRRVDGTMVETNKMSEHMASMRNKMFALDRQVGEASSAVEEIHATVQQVSGQIENQSSAVTQTSASIEQMNSSIQSVARIAEEKQQATRSLLSITENGGEKVQRTDELIREIEGSVKDVMNVISVINKVAAQTNMLAMNAAIEAAHAGDAGRGFSVVAEEIRSLSTNTSESAREISGRLKEIVETIEETTRISGETGEAFKAVSSEVHQFVDAFGEIASSTSQLSSGSREMMNVVTSLRDATTEIRDGSSEMTRGVGDINDTLQYLREYSQSAVEDLQKLNEGAKQVNASQNDLAELIVGNTRSVEGLSEEMSRFTLAGEGAETEHSASGLRGYLSLGILNTQRWLVELRIALDEGREAEEYPRLDESAYAEWLERWARRRFEGTDELGRIEALYEQIRSELTELQRLASSAQGEAAERRGEQEECYLRIVEAMKEVRGILMGLRERDGDSSGELPGDDVRTKGQSGEQSGAEGWEQLEEPGYLEAVESGEPQN